VMREAYRTRRNLLHGRLNETPGLRCGLPEGGMFLMLDVRETGLSAYDFADGLLDATGVSVLAGDAFGPSAAGHVRVSLCVPEDGLLEACDRIARYVRENAKI